MKPSFRVVLPLVGLMACVGDDPVGGAGADAGAPADATTPQRDGDAPDTSTPSDAGPGETGPGDSGPTGRCDPTKEFGTPVLMADLSTSGDDTGFTMTRDELLAFVVRQPGQTLMQATRTNVNGPFDAPVTTGLDDVNGSAALKFDPTISPDGLTLYFAAVATDGARTIHAAARDTRAAAFDYHGVVTSGGLLPETRSPHLSTGATRFYWTGPGTAPATSSLHQTPWSRGPYPGRFNAGALVGTNMERPVVSGDDLTLYYTVGDSDVFRSTRSTTSDSFTPGQIVSALSTASREAPLYLTRDNCVLVLKSDRPGGLGGFDLYMATRPK
jgi:hypothetical protein